MEKSYFDICYQQRAKVRWICKALQFSRFLDVEKMRALIDEKMARIERRRGELEPEVIAQIGENLLLAKVAKRYIERRIRPYQPKPTKNSPTHAFAQSFQDRGLGFSFQESLSPIYKEKHYRLRTNPSILFPGFLPDGNEAFFLLRKCFLKFGSVYYVNYQTRHFVKETIYHQIYDTIVEINNRQLKNAGQQSKPFLVATSFGCHILLGFLRWLAKEGLTNKVSIAGIVVISPVLNQDDVVDRTLERQKTLVGRAVAYMCNADESDQQAVRKAMQKAKSILMKMFTSGRDLMKFEHKDLIPIFAIEDDVLEVFRKEIEDDDGYFQRFMQLKHEPALQEDFISSIPTLVLLAEGEGDVLTENSPTFQICSDIHRLRKIFPNGSVEIVHSISDARKVTHSDLIFQADRFAHHLDHWLQRAIS